MKRKSIFLASLLLCVILGFTSSAWAQSTSISGNIVDAKSNEGLVGVNIIVKGKVIGTITDFDGNFALKVNQAPPLTLQVSIIGYKTQEIEITTEMTTGLSIKLEEEVILGQEVVVSASRVEESILKSPVTIEKMDRLAIESTPSDNYYKAIANLKGVDVASSSINFQIINTRGFGSTGNTRFVQLTDGMDTQAPALNFPIGNLNGPSELDVESLELIPGAASALYGPSAFNGVLLVNSKNAFEYQGLSAFVKQGVNHVDGKDHPISPMYEASLRYAKAFNNKFAFKVNGSFMRATDWHGTDATDREIGRTPNGFSFNPGADRLHFQGDEASINLAILRLSSAYATFAGNNNPYQQNIFFENPNDPNARVTALDYASDLPNHVVSITPYEERDLINYNAQNVKANAGLYYRVNDKMELSYLFNGGWGTSIYTGAQRYSLSNFSIMQHRLQLRSDNFYVRAYTTQENSGDSYITEFLAKRVNDLAVQAANPLFSDVTGYLVTYAAEYSRYLYDNGLNPGDIQGLNADQRLQVEQAAHQYARGITDGKFHLDPNSENFKNIKERAQNGVVPVGPKFNDRSALYHGEAQYDFKNEIDFMSLQMGGSYRVFVLNSNGTIFADTPGNPITISEYGIYAQAAKDITDNLKLSGSLRYDKNQNFKGQINPRLSAVYELFDNHNVRISYQTGFRFPTTQGQHIDLNILTARLLGGLPEYAIKYNLTERSATGEPLAFDGATVNAYSAAVFEQGASTPVLFDPANTGLLTPITELDPVKPERVRSLELGYKSLINNKFLIDFAYYYNIYTDFITQIRVRKATALPDGSPNYASLLNGTADNTFQVYTNFNKPVSSQGSAIGLTYSLPKNYSLSSNYSWNVLIDDPSKDGFLAEFNTPEHKVNVTFANRKLTNNLGFGVTWRWQSAFEWQSSFTVPANGTVDAFQTLDAQLSYRLKELKSVVKVGGSNIFNKYYLQSVGGPNIGAIYYISLTFDQQMN
ncbi:TonB-dependent receptor [Cytophagales bacterium LB-30]|uniref:TonB-dependent receptor n=1 Tax=Shiella aurantiaca TaxID=3058365 RepID=A0ABT8F4X9_9BACT|nr:TonB-dependent receptor [Shiella aurantiaca]MDN4165309.1 TonB-dependent receptor [Shiella aurantiaca]